MENEFDFETLIFDRTTDDLINDTDKAYINASDWNRLNNALQWFIDNAELILPGVRNNWAQGDRIMKDDLDQMLNNIKTVRQRIGVYADTPQLPVSLLGLTFDNANAIEKTLYDAHRRASGV